MKRIQLLVLMDPQSQVETIDYREVIEQVLRMPLDRQSGATIEEMRRGIRVLDALEAAENNVLALEDADWEHLKLKVEHMPWGFVDRRLVHFRDDVCEATDAVRSRMAADMA